MVPLPVLTKQKIMCWSMYYSRSIESKMIAIADCVRMLNGNHWIENTCMRLPQFGQPSHYRAAGPIFDSSEILSSPTGARHTLSPRMSHISR